MFIAPFFAYLGWYGRTANENAFITCKVLSIVIALYHTYLLLKNNSSEHFNNLPNLPNLSNYKNIFNPADTTIPNNSSNSDNIEEYNSINDIEILEDQENETI